MGFDILLGEVLAAAKRWEASTQKKEAPIKIRVFFGQPKDEKDPVLLEAASGEDINSKWFQKDMERWRKDRLDYTSFALIDIEVDADKIRDLLKVPVVEGKVKE